jgi:hypothetical protein
MTAIISAVVAVIAAVVACVQVYVTRRMSDNSLTETGLHSMYDEGTRSHRRTVYRLQGKSPGEWSESELESAEIVAAEGARLGFLFRNNYVRRGPIFEKQAGGFYKTYVILEAYILAERTRLNNPGMWVHYEWLARESMKLRTKADPWWLQRPWTSEVRALPRLAENGPEIQS